MALSWNEIRKRSIEFSKSWEGVEREKAEAQTFWNEFFEVFGQTRRKVAILEQEVYKLNQAKGYIDLFWPKVLIAEAKSRGKDLVKAKEQAISYLHGISDTELPQYILTTDFAQMSLLDLESGESWQFKVTKLHDHIKLFSFIAGYSKTSFKQEDPVNIEAAELMGKLHDSLAETGYSGHPLELFLVRVLFCLFAEDTGIFEKDIFLNYIRINTREDGSDIGPQFAQLFQVLNTPEDKRYKNLDEDLVEFPYVNGKLYEEQIPLASFDSKMRDSLIQCCLFDWAKISPAVFGSLFQSVMDQEKRRNLGAHYTSEQNIMKLIGPLFLDELHEEFEKIKTNKQKLTQFHDKISKLKFLDPACGCGNFLVITYRELRLLEIEILKKLYSGRTLFDIKDLAKTDVDSMYGIEIEEFPAKIAEVAMWLMDHQMNVKLSEELGQYYIRLPLKKSAKIIQGNALKLSWEEVVGKEQLSYILGNPPFAGKQVRSKEQAEEIKALWGNAKGSGTLDYVTGWYIKSAILIQNSLIKVAFVSTNSISQGEQVAYLWDELINKYHIKINFAHRTFQWNNEAKGNAAVHVIIIGFGITDNNEKYIFDYPSLTGQPHKIRAKRINPYLVDANDILILPRAKPLCEVQEIVKGSETTDNGYLLLSELETTQLVNKYAYFKKYIREFVGGGDYINGRNRWCLWLKGAEPRDYKDIPLVIQKLELVREFRRNSPKSRTRYWSEFPTLFTEDRQPNNDYLIFPKVSSQFRKYIPFGVLSKDIIINNTASYIANPEMFTFGVVQSEMHMDWMRNVCGRMKSDYIYSNKVVYNTFPWPSKVTSTQKTRVAEKAQNILEIRTEFQNSTLADLYNPLTMPPKLLKAHKELDLAVDKCYRSKPFKDERERIEYLFELYEKYIANEKGNNPS